MSEKRTSTQFKKDAFLAAYAKCGNVSHACTIAGISRKTHYRWLKDDIVYSTNFVDAKEAAADTLELEARRRAVEGTEKPVFQGGRQVGTIREYSDLLLIFLLKGCRPEKYRDNARIEHAGQVALPDIVTALEQLRNKGDRET